VWNLATIFNTARLWAALILKQSNISIPKYRIWCSDDGDLTSQIWWRSIHPPLRSRVWNPSGPRSSALRIFWLAFGSVRLASGLSTKISKYTSLLKKTTISIHYTRCQSDVICLCRVWTEHIRQAAASLRVSDTCISLHPCYVQHSCSWNGLR